MVHQALHEHGSTEATKDDRLTRLATNPKTNVRKILDTTVDFDLLGLFAACHYRICAKGTTFENNVIDRPTPPGSATVWFLVRLLGKAPAWELLLEGTSLDAEEARAHKLVNAVLPNESFEADAISLAETFAVKPRQAIRTLVVAFNHSSLPIADYLNEVGTGFENIYKED